MLELIRKVSITRPGERHPLALETLPERPREFERRIFRAARSLLRWLRADLLRVWLQELLPSAPAVLEQEGAVVVVQTY